jgi:hypothetical protein
VFDFLGVPRGIVPLGALFPFVGCPIGIQSRCVDSLSMFSGNRYFNHVP